MQCQIVLYIKDHNGNKFYFKLYCVILDELSVFTTLFLSNKNKERRRQKQKVIKMNNSIIKSLSKIKNINLI